MSWCTEPTAAKVDNAAVQDGYHLYHHVFLFTASETGPSQQGETATRRPRDVLRALNVTSFVEEPHGVCCDVRADTLNLVAGKAATSDASAELASLPPETTLRAIEHLLIRLPAPSAVPRDRRRHAIPVEDSLTTYERAPESPEALLGIEGGARKRGGRWRFNRS
jgi:hypothetical protein